MKVKYILIMAILTVILITPMNVEAKQKQAKDMKGIDLAEYRNSNIDEIKKIVKLTKDKKKKNLYYDKYKTTYITTGKSGDIIKITIRGKSKKAQKYAPTFGGAALANDGCMVDYKIESEGIFSIYEDPYTKGELLENKDEDYIMYGQERASNNTITVKSKLLKWQHSDKKVYQISWKRDGVTAENREKYEYHNIETELATSNSIVTLPSGLQLPAPTDTMPKDALIENVHIWVDKTSVLSEPENYLGKRAMFRGIIQKSVDGRMELSNIDSYTTEVTALYNDTVYTSLPTTPIYDMVTTIWGIIIEVNEIDGVVIALDTIFATNEYYPTNFSEYHTIDEVRAGEGTMDMIKMEGSITAYVNCFDINTSEGIFICSNPSFDKVYDSDLINGRKITVYGKMNTSDGSISVVYMEPTI